MKKRAFALLLLFLFIVGFISRVAVASETVVRVGIYDNRPLTFLDPAGVPRGFVVDLLKEIAKEKGFSLRFVPAPWSECLKNLKEGRIDLLGPLAFSQARARIFDFNHATILSNWGVIAVPRKKPLSSILALKGRRIAVLSGDIHATALTHLLKKFDIKARFIPADTYRQVIHLVSDGHADAGVINRLIALKLGKDTPVLASSIIFNPIDVRFAASKGSHRLLLMNIDARLTAWKSNQNSFYYRAFTRWFGELPTGYIFPRWAWWTFAILILGIILLFIFIVFLKHLVRKKTQSLTKEIERRETLETELRESEQDYRERYENLPVSLWYEDFSLMKRYLDHLRETGVEDLRAYLDKNPGEIQNLAALVRVRDVNQTTLKMYGAKSKKELLGNLDRILNTPVSLASFKEEAIQLFEGNLIHESESEILPFKGTPRSSLVRWNVPPGHEISLDFVLVSILDITRRKQAEQKIQRESRRLAILNEIETAILQALSVEVIARVVLPKITDLIKCPRASILRFDLERETCKQIATCGEGQYLQHDSYPLSDFRDIEALKDGRPRIVENLSREPALSKSDRDILNHGILAYVTFPLIADGKLMGTANFARTQPGPFPKQDLEIVEEVTNIMAIALNETYLRTRLQQHARELEATVARKTRQLSVKLGEVERLNAAMANILKGLQASNHSLAETTRDLEEKNREMETFAYSVSHDLRTPLRAMEGFAQALLEDYGPTLDKTGQNYAQRIIKAAVSMDTLIHDLLAYSHLTTREVTLQPVDMNKIVQTSLNAFATKITECRARIAVKHPLGWILGNPTILQQVMDNLISNALKFTAPDETPNIDIYTKKCGKTVRIHVKDRGIGIASAYHGKVFNLFERLHGVETYPGTGVGLTIVKKGIIKLKGEVGFDSKEGKGSTFWFELAIPPSTVENLN